MKKIAPTPKKLTVSETRHGHNRRDDYAWLKDKNWQEKCLHWKEVFPKCEDSFKTTGEVDLYFLAECLSNSLPSNATFVSDSGLIELILPPNISFKNGQRCIPNSVRSMDSNFHFHNK